MATFSKVSERQALKPRRDPYWQKLLAGCYLGFRKMTSGSAGNWSARYLDESQSPPKQVYKLLGDYSDTPDHMRFDAAQRDAHEWFKHLGKGGLPTVVTVKDACDKYVLHIAEKTSKKASDDAKARFESYVVDDKKLAATDLSKLTPAMVEAWRKRLRTRPTTSGPRRGEQRSDSSLNRDMTCFRAALNLAYRDGLVTSNFAWHSKLLPVKSADRKRETYLDLQQRRKLIAAAAPDLANLLRAMSLVPVRPGAIAALTVASYDKRLKTLSIGKDKAGRDRKIALPDASAKFFAQQCKGKLPSAPLLARSNGKAWDKDVWKYPVKDAVKKAKLPIEATIYTLRHSAITDLIHSGLDTLTVAQLSGTSILMIERHYGHLTREHSKSALEKLTL